MPKVYIVNKSSHDFSDAERCGELVFLSEGPMNKFGTNNMQRQFEYKLRESKQEDLILICGLSVMNAIACAIFARKHGRLNLLLFKGGRYIERNHVLERSEKND